MSRSPLLLGLTMILAVSCIGEQPTLHAGPLDPTVSYVAQPGTSGPMVCATITVQNDMYVSAKTDTGEVESYKAEIQKIELLVSIYSPTGDLLSENLIEQRDLDTGDAFEIPFTSVEEAGNPGEKRVVLTLLRVRARAEQHGGLENVEYTQYDEEVSVASGLLECGRSYLAIFKNLAE